MTDPRSQILQLLRRQGPLGVQELAEALGLAPVTVRYHLSVLEQEGKVAREVERRGVGRPRHLYRLTPEARQERGKEAELADQLLRTVKRTLGERAAQQMLEQIAEQLAAEKAAALAGLPLEERLQVLVETLGAEGFLAEWERTGGQILLREYDCPYLLLRHNHPEVCQVDAAVLERILGAPVERTATTDGEGEFCCTFVVAVRPRESMDG